MAFLLGTGLLFVAGIGRLGWSIQSIRGTTPPEQLDQWIFRVLSLFGTFFLIYHFAVGWLTRPIPAVQRPPLSHDTTHFGSR